MNRRDFLKTSAATAALVSVPATLLLPEKVEAVPKLLPPKLPGIKEVKIGLQAIIDYYINDTYVVSVTSVARREIKDIPKALKFFLEDMKRYGIIGKYLIHFEDRCHLSLADVPLALRFRVEVWLSKEQNPKICTGYNDRTGQSGAGNLWYWDDYFCHAEALPVAKWKSPTLLENMDEVFGNTPFVDEPQLYTSGFVVRRAPAWLKKKDARGCAVPCCDACELFWGHVEMVDCKSLNSDLQFVIAKTTLQSQRKRRKYKCSYDHL